MFIVYKICNFVSNHDITWRSGKSHLWCFQSFGILFLKHRALITILPKSLSFLRFLKMSFSAPQVLISVQCSHRWFALSATVVYYKRRDSENIRSSNSILTMICSAKLINILVKGKLASHHKTLILSCFLLLEVHFVSYLQTKLFNTNCNTVEWAVKRVMRRE
jgi:hypothetical protein